MFRGTTPQLIFHINFDTSRIKQLYVTIKNERKEPTVIEKTIEDCELDGEIISTTLTQEETLQFKGNEKINIQLRILTNEDIALASQLFPLTMEKILKDGVIK